MPKITFCALCFIKHNFTGMKRLKEESQLVGFEPTPSERNRFQVYRLNHSATTADDLLVLEGDMN